MIEPKKLNDYFPEWYNLGFGDGAGVFDLLVHSGIKFPWLSNSDDAWQLNLVYHGQRTLRFASPFLIALGGLRPNVLQDTLPKSINKIYGSDWVALWDALALDYDAIHPFTQTKVSSETGSLDVTTSDNHSHSIHEHHITENSGVDNYNRTDTFDSSVTQGATHTTTKDTLTKSGEEKVSVAKSDETLLPDETTTVTESFSGPNGVNPYTETTTQNGSQLVREKGGTVRSVWGFDSDSPVKSDKVIATGGDGASNPDGTGDGSAPEDGHVTDTTYRNYETKSEFSGQRVTDTKKTYSARRTDTVMDDTTTSYEERTDTRDIDAKEDAVIDSQKDSRLIGDVTNYGKKIDVTDDASGSNTQNGSRTQRSTSGLNQTITGNIGVFTSQAQLEQEYELRKKHFFDVVFADLDKLLTIPIFNSGVNPEGGFCYEG